MRSNEDNHGGLASLEAPLFDHDDPSEPPPTEYPGAGVSAWPQYPQAMQQTMMVVSNPVGPPGVWDCTQVPMMMMSSGADAQAVSSQMMWSFPEQQQWQPEVWPQADEPMPSFEAPAFTAPTPAFAATPVSAPAPTSAPTPAPTANADEPAPKRRSSPRPKVNESAERTPRSRSHTRPAMTGIAGEARHRAEQAKDASWPRLTLESIAAKVQSEGHVRTPMDSVWRDPPPSTAKPSSSEKPAAAKQVSKPVTARAVAAAPAVPAAVAAIVPRKVATRDIAVQCELLSAASKEVALTPLCKHCGSLPAAELPTTKHAGLAGHLVQMSAALVETTAQGPASDWAWDSYAKTDNTDDWNELSSSAAIEEVRTRQLPPAPSLPPPLPPQGSILVSSKPGGDEGCSITCPTSPGGDSSSATTCSASSECSPSQSLSSPSTSSLSGFEARQVPTSNELPVISHSSVSQMAPALVKGKTLAAVKTTQAKTKPVHEPKPTVKDPSSANAGQTLRQSNPVHAAPAATGNTKSNSKRFHPVSQKEGKKSASKVSCRFFNLKLKSIVAGLVATVALLVAQGGFEFRTLGLATEEAGPVSEEVDLTEMASARVTAKQVKNEVQAARQRIMDKEWKPLQARFDEAYRAARKQRNSDRWWLHHHAQIVEEQQARLRHM